MSNFWQAVIPAALTDLVAGRVAVTRTGRLRKDIHENLGLLRKLPADHPNRATLEAHNAELPGLLVRRQQRRFGRSPRPGLLRRPCQPSQRGVRVRLRLGAAGHRGPPLILHPRPQTRRPLGISGPRQCSS